MRKPFKHPALALYRKICVKRRQALWLYAQNPQDGYALMLYRNLSVLRRQVKWILFPPPPNWARVLKRIYAPAITRLFAQQSTLYDLLLQAKKKVLRPDKKGFYFSVRRAS